MMTLGFGKERIFWEGENILGRREYFVKILLYTNFCKNEGFNFFQG